MISFLLINPFTDSLTTLNCKNNFALWYPFSLPELMLSEVDTKGDSK
jgi:hypothetical protein